MNYKILISPFYFSHKNKQRTMVFGMIDNQNKMEGVAVSSLAFWSKAQPEIKIPITNSFPKNLVK